MKLRNMIVPVSVIVGIGGAFFVPNDWTVLWVFLWPALGAGITNWVFPEPSPRYSEYDPNLGITIHFQSTPLVLVCGKNTLVLSVTGDKELSIGDRSPNGSHVTSDGKRDYADLMAGMFKIAKVREGYRVTWPGHKQPWILL